MTVLIETEIGDIPLSGIERIKEGASGPFARLAGGTAADVYSDLGLVLVSIIPAAGWELVMALNDDAGRPDEIVAEPVIAWGLTVHGRIRPITPSFFNEKAFAPWALRKIGDPMVHEPDGSNCGDQKSWLAMLQRRHDWEVERRARQAGGVSATT